MDSVDTIEVLDINIVVVYRNRECFFQESDYTEEDKRSEYAGGGQRVSIGERTDPYPLCNWRHKFANLFSCGFGFDHCIRENGYGSDSILSIFSAALIS